MAFTKYKDKDAGVVLSFGGQWISWSHTIIAYCMSASEDRWTGW